VFLFYTPPPSVDQGAHTPAITDTNIPITIHENVEELSVSSFDYDPSIANDTAPVDNTAATYDTTAPPSDQGADNAATYDTIAPPSDQGADTTDQGTTHSSSYNLRKYPKRTTRLNADMDLPHPNVSYGRHQKTWKPRS
jgi:hypothetical protein